MCKVNTAMGNQEVEKSQFRGTFDHSGGLLSQEERGKFPQRYGYNFDKMMPVLNQEPPWMNKADLAQLYGVPWEKKARQGERQKRESRAAGWRS